MLLRRASTKPTSTAGANPKLTTWTRTRARRSLSTNKQLVYRGVELPYIYAGNSRGDGRRVAALLITEARQLARAL